RNTPGVQIMLVKCLKDTEDRITEYQRQDKEQRSHQTGTSDVGARVFEAEDDCQHDDTDNIVDDCGTHNRGSDDSFQMSQFLKGAYRNRDRSCCYNTANHHCLEEVLTAPGAESVKCFV